MLITDRQGNGQRRYPIGGVRPAVVAGQEYNPVTKRIAWNSSYSAFPVGGGLGSLILPLGEGGMGAKISGLGTLAGAINGRAQMASSLTGSSTLTVASYGLTMLIQAVASLSGSGALVAGVNGRAGMEATINVSQLTENDVAGVVLDAPIDGNYTLRQVLAILASVAAGKTNIVDNGGGSATLTFRGLNDDVDRVVADMQDSERQTITFDLD